MSDGLEEMKYMAWNEPSSKKGYGMVIAITFAVLIIIAAIGITVAVLNQEEEQYIPAKSYTAVMTDVKVLLSQDYYTVDYGEDGERLYYEVYWDDDNSGEFQVGELCKSWNYYENSDANIKQAADKVCRIDIEDLEHQVGLTACMYDGQDNKYDIYSGDSEYGSCVMWDNQNIEPSALMGYVNCYSTIGGTTESYPHAMVADGLNDDDSNQYNSKLEFTWTLEYTYDCIET